MLRLLAALALLSAVTPALASGSCPTRLPASATVEELYNAGVCFEESREVGLAIRLYQELLRRHPRAALTPRAMVRLAVLYEKIAMFDRAAELDLQYARRYAGERDAPVALSNAVYLFAALGRDREAIAAAEEFIKLYGRKRKGDAAEAAFFIGHIIERGGDQDRLVAHLETYLRDFGTRGGRDRAAIAHARLGLILWERSCPVRSETGGCRRRARARSRVPRCGGAAPIATRRVSRDRALANRARRHLEQATRLFAPTPSMTPRQHAAAGWVAAAELTLLERDFEDYLDITFPAGLDFDPKQRQLQKRSIERFTTWLETKNDAGRRLRDRYADLGTRPTAWARVAAARHAQLALDLRDQLMSSPIPRIARTGPYAKDLTEAYCGALADQAGPLEAAALAGLERCASAAVKASDPWASMCRAELSRLRPREYPARLEVHGRADHAGAITDRAGDVR